ncbi:MAG: succinate dehydrogenase/fumarate reductase iron-sulfur subunit [Methanobrevibacter sp.]|nr:succinate dehydrogenase/fumarate reductase iron-sulfur subunit [Methanobrevibacter sp.]
MIEIKVLRFDKEKDNEPHFEKYEIEKTHKMKVLDALIAINEKYNTNLSFRSSCRAGQCGSCALKMNEEIVLACKAEIEDDVTIEPLDFPVIKDLIVDKSEIEEKIARMGLYLEADDNLYNNETKYDIQTNECTCPSIIESIECVDTKKVRSCIECYSCLSACPVIKVSSEFAGPYFMRYLSKFDFDPRDTGKRTEESIEEGLYYCTSCGKCGEVCPKEINSFGDAIEKLRALANNKNLGPLEAHKEVKKMIESTGRSIESVEESFIEAVNKKKSSESEAKEKIKQSIIDKKSKIAVFTGCMIDYRLQDLGFALIDVLKKNGIEVDVPENQVCCGSPMLRTGQTNIVNDLVEKNKKVFSKYDTIITMCAGCGATLKKDYPKYGVKFNILDISEFLTDNLDTNQMKDLNMKVTYHDPCHLVRGQEITEEPRKILNKIKGIEFIEMEKPDQCCGAGGGVRAGKPEIAFSLGKQKADMIKKLDVDAVISICPFCQYNIQDALDKEGLENIKVMNILELLKKAYQ